MLLLSQGGALARKAAVHTLVLFVRHAHRGMTRVAALETLLASTRRGNSWWRRLLFLDAVGAAVWLFSRTFVKDKLLPLVLELLKVRVVWRSRVCGWLRGRSGCLTHTHPCPGLLVYVVLNGEQDRIPNVRQRALLTLLGMRRWLVFPKVRYRCVGYPLQRVPPHDCNPVSAFATAGRVSDIPDGGGL